MGDIGINFNSPLPFIDANLTWFRERIQAGQQDGSLTSDEQTVLNEDITQVQQQEQQDEQGQTVTDAQQQTLWNDVAEVNSDIYSMRRNPLGTTLPQSGVGAPEVITEQNYTTHPAVNTANDTGTPPAQNQSGYYFDPTTNSWTIGPDSYTSDSGIGGMGMGNGFGSTYGFGGNNGSFQQMTQSINQQNQQMGSGSFGGMFGFGGSNVLGDLTSLLPLMFLF